MNEQYFTNLLIENIQFQLRHSNYDRALEIRKFAHMMTTGEGQDEEVLRYRRFEDTDLKKQRVRLYNSRTKYALARPRKYWKRVSRVEGIRRVITGSDDKKIQALKDGFYNFMPGQDLEAWLNKTLEFYGVTDPNAWIVYERNDKRNQDGTIIETRVWPAIFAGVDVLNFLFSKGNLEWLLCRTMAIEPVIENGARTNKILENFFLYFPGGIVRMREIGERTAQEPGEQIQQVEVLPEKINSDVPVYVGQAKLRSFYLKVIDNGTTEVPALYCGCYEDENTGSGCFVPWFYPAEHVFYDLIRHKSSLDVTETVHTYPKRAEYVKGCTFTDPEKGQCVRGYFNDIRTDEHRCTSCGGTGRAVNFTTDQEAVQLIMPDDPTQMLELNKLAFTEPIDITLPKFLDEQCEKDEARIMSAVFDTGLYQKPNQTQTRTATEIDAVMEGIADVLTPFANLNSRHFELAYRVGAQYMEIPEFAVDHSYPDEFDIANLYELVASFGEIKDKGVGYEAIAASRARVFQKMFEGDPDQQKRILARYKWLPFDDKSPESVAMILAARSPYDNDRVLWENHLGIFKEIEIEQPNFAYMEYPKQKEIVTLKVDEFKERILLIDAVTDPVNDQNIDPNQQPGS